MRGNTPRFHSIVKAMLLYGPPFIPSRLHSESPGFAPDGVTWKVLQILFLFLILLWFTFRLNRLLYRL